MTGFEGITNKIAQLNSLAYALEGAIIQAEGHDAGDAEARRMLDLFYVLQEGLEQLQKDADELGDHISVCNAIYAVNHVKEMRAELAELRANRT